jgi:hypothetical protein
MPKDLKAERNACLDAAHRALASLQEFFDDVTITCIRTEPGGATTQIEVETPSRPDDDDDEGDQWKKPKEKL